MPTLIGWAGATNRIDPQAWYLCAILFLWQFPHFLAIALMYREDYERAGYRMLPAFDADSRFTRAEIVGFAVVLVAATVLPGVARQSVWYSGSMLLAGSLLLYSCVRLAQTGSRIVATRVLHHSVIYLPVVLAVMAFMRC